MTYASELIREQLQRGPYAGEDFFRVKVTGDGQTKWFNVSAGELRAFAELVDDAGETTLPAPDATTWDGEPAFYPES